MSDLFDDDPRVEGGRARSSRRSRILLIVVAVLLLGFIGLSGFSALWTDRLWFKYAGYGGVFNKLILTRIGLFAAFAVLMAVIVGVNMVLAYRFRPLMRPSGPSQISLERYREAVEPVRWWLLAGVTVLLGIFAGISGAGQWRNFLMWRNGTPFGTQDDYFERDLGFYIFSLPWWHYVVDFAMIAVIVALLMAALVHYIYGGIRLQVRGDRLSTAAQVQLSVLLGVLVLVKAVDYWLDRFDLVTDSGGLLTGMTYTADHAVLPAKNILAGIALICAVLFFLNIWRKTWLLPSVGVVLLALSGILLGLIWPAIVQNFQVRANQADKEEPYIANNIAATREAYGLTDVNETAYGEPTDSSKTPDKELRADAQRTGVRLVDPSVVSQTFEQEQQRAGYYSVPEVLDVDRYPGENGSQRDLVLSVRELNQDGLPDSSKNWANLHTVYTHGYGMIAAYGNQRDSEGKPTSELAWAERDLPPQGMLTDLAGDDGYRGQIYYGEQSPEYSIVGKKSEDDRDIEVDLPKTGSEDDSGRTNTYSGDGGVPIGGFFNKLLYAIKFSEPNIILSDRVHENSKILYDRNPADMVRKVAPWLQVDGDAYPAMVDGKVVWILDGYTTSDRYPSSDRESFETMVSDALEQNPSLQALPTDEINYMRNAVKATVDAYDGTVTLYQWDEDDPILNTWMKVFPDTVKQKADIPEDLLDHLRYPEDMFKVQRYQLARYHVTNADDFYKDTDRWQVPADPNEGSQLQPPYRLSVLTPDGGNDPNFSLTSVYTPYRKENLASFVSVNSDPTSDDYGQFEVLAIRGSEQIDGPGQIRSRFATDEKIRERLRAFTQNQDSRIIYGNLLTLPVGKGLFYVQPIYGTREGGTGIPELEQIAVSFGDRIGSGNTLDEAINDALGLEGDTGQPTGGGDGDQGDGQGDQSGDGTTSESELADLIQEASDHYDKAQEAAANGDWTTFGEEMEAMQEALDQAGLAIEDLDTGSGSKGSGKGSGSGSGDAKSDDGGGGGSGE